MIFLCCLGIRATSVQRWSSVGWIAMGLTCTVSTLMAPQTSCPTSPWVSISVGIQSRLLAQKQKNTCTAAAAENRPFGRFSDRCGPVAREPTWRNLFDKDLDQLSHHPNAHPCRFLLDAELFWHQGQALVQRRREQCVPRYMVI